MTTPIIRVENLGKRYQLGARSNARSRYRSLAEELTTGAKQLFRRDRARKSTEEFWALRDVSFEVQQGEVLGIIGRNGAGKSTLLKILSRITEPTTGKVSIKGRVASLLEVGTGFHPELTGRENIFLNGAILGMSRAEIKAKFDEIVAFAEVEKFLETPVKRYSSGMYVRLAFAVAAHLDPEILVIDEVLAVGDAEFQKKCLGKMQEVSRGGRTVLFVSHNIAAITALCSSGILLDAGSIRRRGPVQDVMTHYAERTTAIASDELNVSQRSGSGRIQIRHLSVAVGGENSTSAAITCAFTYTAEAAGLPIQFLIGIYDTNKALVLFLDSLTAVQVPERFPQAGSIELRLSDQFMLPAGLYHVNIAALIRGELADYLPDAFTFTIEPSDFFQSGRLPSAHSPVLVQQEWQVNATQSTR